MCNGREERGRRGYRTEELRCSNRNSFLIELQRYDSLLFLSRHVYTFHQLSSTRSIIENIRNAVESKKLGGKGKRKNVEGKKRMRVKKKREVDWTFRESGLEPIRK
jgi:hypothetical protein